MCKAKIWADISIKQKSFPMYDATIVRSGKNDNFQNGIKEDLQLAPLAVDWQPFWYSW